mmetsp:Transcript_77356/g.136420  ORF Transcript_77356/g.136420 Transcript_77356/m.136420 type:complete len:94 (+) Transcript_77356:265-546(+)
MSRCLINVFTGNAICGFMAGDTVEVGTVAELLGGTVSDTQNPRNTYPAPHPTCGILECLLKDCLTLGYGPLPQINCTMVLDDPARPPNHDGKY